MAKQPKKKTQPNKKHYILYNNGGVISATKPRDWARGNRNLFPNYNFANSANTPRDIQIETFLSNQRGFQTIENDDIVILYEYVGL